MADNSLCYDGVPIPSNGTSTNSYLNKRGERKLFNKSGLLLESVRLETFAFWNSRVIDSNHLARSGFYFMRTLDQVQCVLCNGIIGQFSQEDDADREHWRHFNHKCPFIKGEPTGNVPLNSPKDDLQHLYIFLKDYYNSLSKVVSINVSAEPMFPTMNTEEVRKKTFKEWPKNVEVNQESLVEAGFCSVGAGDLVQCFHCGGCMFNWLKEDDPVRDHARIYPNCVFIQRMTNTITSALPKTGPQPRPLTEEEADLILHHPIAVRLMELGVPQQIVRTSLKKHLEKNGVLPRTVSDGMNTMNQT